MVDKLDMKEDDSKLLHWWQTQYFKGEDENNSSLHRADALRNLMFSTVYGGETNNLPGHATSSLYAHLADKYANIIDSSTDKGGLDNFAEQALSLSEGHKNESGEWKSALSMDLPCVKRLISTCQESHNSFFNATWEEEISHCFKKPATVSEPSTTHTHTKSLFKQTGNNQQQTKGNNYVSVYNQSSTRANISENAFSMQNRPSNGEAGGRFRNNNVDAKSCHTVPTGSRKTVYSTEHMQEKPGTSKQGCKRKTTSDMDVEDMKEDNRPPRRDFRTAREQLAIENQKQNRGQVNSTSYGGSKKTLGPRRAGRGFIPPVMNRGDDDYESNMVTRKSADQSNDKDEPIDERLKNIDQKMVELIMNEIMDNGLSVTWDDIAGLEFAKNTIKEIVVWPMLRPDIFTGLRGPPKGLLLFGPPGTGKTLIGKCIASQSKSTFFSISASSLTSKWVGEGEKMVRALFAVARCQQPAVIFIDEIDSLLAQRSDTEHESSRRIKTEFLVQLDGATTSAEDRILVVGATNRPQELDEAARRRFVKRLYIPLPEDEARKQIVVHLLQEQSHRLSQEELQNITIKTQGYSGADMANLCREAALGPIRSMSFQDIQNITADQVRPILYTDFENAIHQVRASVTEADLNLYLDWNSKFGSWSV